MTRDDEFIGRLEDYLETFYGVTPLPGRVRDAIHADLPRTRQVRPDRGMGRIWNMLSRASTPARVGMVAAVLVAAVILGAAVLTSGRAIPGVGSAPTPVTSPTPPPAELRNGVVQPCAGAYDATCLTPGVYTLSSTTPGEWPARVTFAVPAGWFSWEAATGMDGVLVERNDVGDGSGWGVVFMTVGSVAVDPCDASKGTHPAAATATVDGLIAAMRSWPGFTVSTSTPISIDGFDGQLVEVTSSRDAASCTAQRIWTTAAGSPVDAYPMIAADGVSRPVQLRILDIGGTPLVIRTTDFPGTSPFEADQGIRPDPTRHADDQVALHHILDSISLSTPGP